MNKYKCPKCGFIYDDEKENILFTDLDDNYFCPFCLTPKKEFTLEEEQPKKEVVEKRVQISPDNPSIARIEEKCINCGICKNICENVVGIKYKKEDVLQPICINCGQCVVNCPTGALVTKYNYKKVLNYLNDTDYIVTVSLAPAVRVALQEEFNQEAGANVTKKIVTALKNLGFDYVFDLTFGADLTIMEEATELVKRLKTKENLPMFTSCCPSWVKYMELYHDDLLNHLSTCKSPIGMQAAVINSYFILYKDIPKDKIINVMVAPCTAKKYEINRDEITDMDYVITTRELAMMLRECEIDFNSLEESEFDELLGGGSGAGDIFGTSGGVMESALRCAYHIVTNEDAPVSFYDLESVRGNTAIKEAKIKMGNYDLKICAVFGMPNLEKVLKDTSKYDFIEVMNCPLGCVGGGGQPLGVISKMTDDRIKRSKGLYNIDANKKIRVAYKNVDIINLYRAYLHYPGSPKAHKLLHTTFNRNLKSKYFCKK